MPSQPSLHACSKRMSPSPSKNPFKTIPDAGRAPTLPAFACGAQWSSRANPRPPAQSQERVRRQGADGRSRQRKPRREVIAVARYEPDDGSIAASHDAESVMLDFVNPIRPCRRFLGRGRQAGFDEMADTPSRQHGRLIGTGKQRVESVATLAALKP
jgi:hypothetical protein